ncbi:glycosyltransferase [Anaerobium acetethylicum]|uniref:Glycosyltransferase EpsH n=1 Tax=Anaerobium acetethylicum TaxID=1619234 RepID=A0A1D3TRA7_9FIRM|nr:glycosyltransferase family 2 protein [Anaerobium acetethylicum]SCP96259.1 glycosyltransferase EpsH [Anaerobium acetethylicum]
MEQDRITIIIPVYNVESYLAECLDSAVGQSWKNTEILLVDDGSTDGSGAICDSYALKDARVRVLHKRNGGVSAARNDALDMATGRFVTFIDSDDWIDPDTCRAAYEAMEEHGADAVLWPYLREMGDKTKKRELFPEDVRIFEGDEGKDSVRDNIQRRMIGLVGEELLHPDSADSLVSVCMKLYRTSIIRDNGLRFVDLKEIGSSEDALFNLEYFGHVKKCVYINRYLYHYRRTNAASVTTKYRPQLYSQWDRLYDRMEDYIESNHLGESYRTALDNRIALGLIGHGFNELNSGAGTLEQIRKIRYIISRERYQRACRNLDLRYFPIHWKVFFLCGKRKSATGIWILSRTMEMLRKL